MDAVQEQQTTSERLVEVAQLSRLTLPQHSQLRWKHLTPCTGDSRWADKGSINREKSFTLVWQSDKIAVEAIGQVELSDLVKSARRPQKTE